MVSIIEKLTGLKSKPVAAEPELVERVTEALSSGPPPTPTTRSSGTGWAEYKKFLRREEGNLGLQPDGTWKPQPATKNPGQDVSAAPWEVGGLRYKWDTQKKSLVPIKKDDTFTHDEYQFHLGKTIEQKKAIAKKFFPEKEHKVFSENPGVLQAVTDYLFNAAVQLKGEGQGKSPKLRHAISRGDLPAIARQVFLPKGIDVNTGLIRRGAARASWVDPDTEYDGKTWGYWAGLEYGKGSKNTKAFIDWYNKHIKPLTDDAPKDAGTGTVFSRAKNQLRAGPAFPGDR